MGARHTDTRWLVVAHAREIPGFASLSFPGWEKRVLGIGQFAALSCLAEMLAYELPQAVLLVGTAGTTEEQNVGKIFLANHFAYPQIKDEELPEFIERYFTTQPALVADFPRATLLQNHGVSLRREKFYTNAAHIPADFPQPVLENMEATSLAEHCRRKQVPFSALIAVSNTIGSNARNEWRKNFRTAGQKLALALRRCL
ncbi:MAG: hypothetical protein N2Z22_02280 [Turneriella sp.]|nr:hypothetical protein [Turneriella sp.]